LVWSGEYPLKTTVPNHSSQTPNWQPLTQLPLIAQMIDEELAETETQYQNLQAAKSRPHILDDYTVGRLVEVFGKRQEFFEIYTEQLARWKAENLDATQKKRAVEDVARGECSCFGVG